MRNLTKTTNEYENTRRKNNMTKRDIKIRRIIQNEGKKKSSEKKLYYD